jgi:hypothetical protein
MTLQSGCKYRRRIWVLVDRKNMTDFIRAMGLTSEEKEMERKTEI